MEVNREEATEDVRAQDLVTVEDLTETDVARALTVGKEGGEEALHLVHAQDLHHTEELLPLSM